MPVTREQIRAERAALEAERQICRRRRIRLLIAAAVLAAIFAAGSASASYLDWYVYVHGRTVLTDLAEPFVVGGFLGYALAAIMIAIIRGCHFCGGVIATALLGYPINVLFYWGIFLGLAEFWARLRVLLRRDGFPPKNP